MMRREDYERQGAPPGGVADAGREFAGIRGTFVRIIQAKSVMGVEGIGLVLHVDVAGTPVLVPVESKEHMDHLIQIMIAARNSVWPQR